MDNVAEWLTRLTANQFLSGAQVRVLPLSLFFYISGTWCKGSMWDFGSPDRGSIPRVLSSLLCEWRRFSGSLFFRGVFLFGFCWVIDNLCFLVLRVRGFESPPPFVAEVTKRSNVRDSREMASGEIQRKRLEKRAWFVCLFRRFFCNLLAWLAQW